LQIDAFQYRRETPQQDRYCANAHCSAVIESRGISHTVSVLPLGSVSDCRSALVSSWQPAGPEIAAGLHKNVREISMSLEAAATVTIDLVWEQ
jgi:hypothetical protein